MVTKGYRKGVYKWVTLGIRDWDPGRVGESVVSARQRTGRPLDSCRDGGATLLVQMRYGAWVENCVVFRLRVEGARLPSRHVIQFALAGGKQ
jgi:hypothetical protein